MFRFRYRFPKYWEANLGGSGGSSANAVEQALAAAQKQLTEITSKYEALQTKVNDGKLVDPTTYLQVKLDAGEFYPKERYVGLQQTLQKEQEAKKAAEEALAALRTSHEDLTAKFGTLEADIKTKASELDTTKVTLKRTQVLVEKYPELLPFEFPGEGKQSLLPAAPVEELETVLGTFASKLGVMSEDAKKKFAAGGGGQTPPPEPENKPTKAADHLRLAREVLQSDAPDRQKQYDMHYDNYLAALNQEEAKT